MFVFHPAYVAPLPPGHRFPMGKYAATRAAILSARPRARMVEPEPATRAQLLGVHGAAYVESVLSARVPPAIERRIGFPVTSAVARRARLSVGGTLEACRLALAHGFAANLAGGSHHAMPDHGAGYCVLNDLAIAAADLLATGVVRRLLILDLDVHQGDGTAVCLAPLPLAFTFSMHAERNFPVRKACSSRDVGLPDGCDDAHYLETLEAELPRLFEAARPDLVLVQAGVDVHAADRLGRLALTDCGLVARSRLVGEACRALGVPLAATLGGGYDEDVAALARRHALALLALAPCENAIGAGATAA
ncbi:histone deacetylase family protein [Thermaurantiacus sp.]